MLEFIQEMGKALLSNAIQLTLGMVLSIPFIFLKFKYEKQSAVKAIILILAAALAGMIFPLGPYGLIPLVTGLYAAGVRVYVVLPFIVSNSIFNLLFAYNDPWFVWNTGIRRILFAFGTAALAGFMLYLSKLHDNDLISKKLNKSIIAYGEVFPSAAKSLMRNLLSVGIFMTVGVILDTFFNKFALWKIFELFYMNPQTAQIPQFFSSYDVDKPFFTLLLVIFKLFTNLTALSAMVYLLKRRGIVLFIGFYGLLALLLALFFFL